MSADLGYKMAAISRIFLMCVLSLSFGQEVPLTIELDGVDWMLRDASGNVTNVGAVVPGQAHLDLMYVKLHATSTGAVS